MHAGICAGGGPNLIGLRASRVKGRSYRDQCKECKERPESAGRAGEVWRMRVPHVEEIANRNGPESCAQARKGMGEALTGGGTGRVLSREILTNFGAPTPWDEAEGSTARRDFASGGFGSARSETLSMYSSTSHGSREIPCSARGGALVRTGNSEEVPR